MMIDDGHDTGYDGYDNGDGLHILEVLLMIMVILCCFVVTIDSNLHWLHRTSSTDRLVLNPTPESAGALQR